MLHASRTNGYRQVSQGPLRDRPRSSESSYRMTGPSAFPTSVSGSRSRWYDASPARRWRCGWASCRYRPRHNSKAHMPPTCVRASWSARPGAGVRCWARDSYGSLGMADGATEIFRATLRVAAPPELVPLLPRLGLRIVGGPNPSSARSQDRRRAAAIAAVGTRRSESPTMNSRNAGTRGPCSHSPQARTRAAQRWSGGNEAAESGSSPLPHSWPASPDRTFASSILEAALRRRSARNVS